MWSAKCETFGCVKADPILEKTFLPSTKLSVTSGDIIAQKQQVVSGCDDGIVYVHSTKPGTSTRPLKFPGHSGVITSVAATPSGARIASASADKTVRVWENSNRGNFTTIRGHTGTVRSVAWSQDERFILTASDDKTVKMYAGVRSTSAPHGDHKFLGSFLSHVNWVRSAQFACDGRSVISGGDDKTVRLFDVETRKPLMAFYEHEDKVNMVAGHPKHSSVLGSVGSDGNFHIFDARESNQPLVQCYKDAHSTASVTSLSFHPGGFYAMTCGKDSLVRLWDLREGRSLWTLQPVMNAQSATSGGPHNLIGSLVLNASTPTLNFACFDREAGTQFLVGAADGISHRFLSNLVDEPVALVLGKAGLASKAQAKVNENIPPKAKTPELMTSDAAAVRTPKSTPSPKRALARPAGLETVIALLERLETRITKLEDRMNQVERLV